jgi:hypothetical protein
MLPSEKANDAINIAKAAKAAKTTARLNLRIRFSYACAQSISPLLARLRPPATSNPLPFTQRFYIDRGRGLRATRNSPEKQIYRLSLKS